MGRQALSSHMKGKNTSNTQNETVSPTSSSKSSILSTAYNSPTLSTSGKKPTYLAQNPKKTFYDSGSSSALCPLGDRDMKQYLFKEEISKAEIAWAIHAHKSFRSAA